MRRAKALVPEIETPIPVTMWYIFATLRTIVIIGAIILHSISSHKIDTIPYYLAILALILTCTKLILDHSNRQITAVLSLLASAICTLFMLNVVPKNILIWFFSNGIGALTCSGSCGVLGGIEGAIVAYMLSTTIIFAIFCFYFLLSQKAKEYFGEKEHNKYKKEKKS